MKFKKFWYALLIIAVLFVVSFTFTVWSILNDLSKPEVVRSWTKTSPKGSVTYEFQAMKRIMIGPPDVQHLLIWKTLNGEEQSYLISLSTRYDDLEFRMRDDGRAIWLIAWQHKKIYATLDLTNGKFTSASGTEEVWTEDGPKATGRNGHPAWATLAGGRSLGRKKW